jgi:anti-sigma factor (TIGR02949 family)
MSALDRMSCEETFRKLDDWVDRALEEYERDAVEEHLAQCAKCAVRFRFEETVISEIRNKVRRIRIPDHLRRRIAEGLSRAEKP